MKIDFDRLRQMSGASTVGSEADNDAHGSDQGGSGPAVSPQLPNVDGDGVIGEGGQSALPTEPADTLRFSTEATTPAPVVATKPTQKFWSWKRKAPKAEAIEAQSPATKVNQGRYVIIAGMVFAAGIVVAPWFAGRTANVAPEQPLGSNAAAVVASTLSNSAMGITLPTGAASAPVDAGASAESQSATVRDGAQPQVAIPDAGEARYSAMLSRIKGDGVATGSVPAIAVDQIPKSPGKLSGSSSQESSAVKVIPRIPLNIETGQDASETTVTEPNNAKATDLFKVVRIDTNRVGELVAYIAPIAGRDATQGAWVFVGDTTVNGFYIEGITPYHVLMRAPNGRVQQLTP